MNDTFVEYKIETLESLINKYKQVRQHTLELMKPLSIEDHVAQPMLDASPPKWHLGHTTWFFEAMVLKPFSDSYREFDSKFPFYFNSYYEGAGERIERGSRGILTRPPLERIYQYREAVDSAMQTFMERNTNKEAKELIELGLNHEQQHQELFLTDFKYTLSVQPFSPVYNENFKEGSPIAATKWIDIEEGIYEIGHDGDSFSFDNEKNRHKVYLNSYRIASEAVTNKDWLEFIEAGGYSNFEHWHSEGWDWVKKSEIKAPAYWKLVGDNWNQFTLSGLKPVNLDEPVSHISYYEAFAYAEWRGMRLPTEQEWEVANTKFNWGQRWEWTNSAYLPYPGFEKPAGTVGEYNGKFMVNQMVLRGSSVATSVGHSRDTYRNFFHPHLRWQFTGLRLAKNI